MIYEVAFADTQSVICHACGAIVHSTRTEVHDQFHASLAFGPVTDLGPLA